VGDTAATPNRYWSEVLGLGLEITDHEGLQIGVGVAVNTATSGTIERDREGSDRDAAWPTCARAIAVGRGDPVSPARARHARRETAANTPRAKAALGVPAHRLLILRPAGSRSTLGTPT